MHANLGTLTLLLRSLGEDYETEYRFHEARKWRFDIAIPRLRVAIEYNGHGTTGGKAHIGRHASVTGMAGDCEKLNQAQALGWIVIQFTALHFDMAARMKHKLTSPRETLETIIRAAREAL